MSTVLVSVLCSDRHRQRLTEEGLPPPERCHWGWRGKEGGKANIKGRNRMRVGEREGSEGKCGTPMGRGPMRGEMEGRQGGWVGGM